MDSAEHLDTHHKALTLNLDATIFGSFAEIGAGQEVARWFLQVGGASGTVAKSISAYDKEVSDHLYGRGTRYVSRERLEAMLDHEWNDLQTQLRASHGSTTRFFVFADTVSARNYAGTNECHPAIDVFSFLGAVAARLLFDAGHLVRKEFRSEAKGCASPEA